MKKDTETMALPLLALEPGAKQQRGNGDLPPYLESMPREAQEIVLKELFGNCEGITPTFMRELCKTSKEFNDLVCNNEEFWHEQCTERGWDRKDRTTGYHEMKDGQWRAQFWKWCELRFDNRTLGKTVYELISWLNLNTPLDFTGKWPDWAKDEKSVPPYGGSVESAWSKVKKYGPIETWDTSKVTSMSYLFRDHARFNGDVGKWDVSNVEIMDSMFHNAGSFDRDLSLWKVAKVRSMDRMFMSALEFNQNLNSWDVSKVVVMEAMFANAYNFNNGQPSMERTNPLTWDVSSLKQANAMFFKALAFNQDLRNKEGNGLWYAPLLQRANSMFYKTGLEAAGRIPKKWRPGLEPPVFETPPVRPVDQ